MINLEQQSPIPEPTVGTNNDRPNEDGNFNIEGFVKIFDPETQEVIVEMRA
jgi:hypothetical protein